MFYCSVLLQILLHAQFCFYVRFCFVSSNFSMFAGDKLGQNETYKSSNCVILSWSSFPLSAMLSTRVTITLMALPLWCSAQSPLHALRSLDCSTRTLFQAARRRGIVHEGVMWLSHNEITSLYAVASHLQGETILSCPYSQVPWHL